MEYPTWLSNLKILLDYNKPDAKDIETNVLPFVADPALKRDRYPDKGKGLSHYVAKV